MKVEVESGMSKSLSTFHFSSFNFEFGVVVQLVRTPACHAGGRGFESRRPRQLSLPLDVARSPTLRRSAARAADWHESRRPRQLPASQLLTLSEAVGDPRRQPPQVCPPAHDCAGELRETMHRRPRNDIRGKETGHKTEKFWSED